MTDPWYLDIRIGTSSARMLWNNAECSFEGIRMDALQIPYVLAIEATALLYFTLLSIN